MYKKYLTHTYKLGQNIVCACCGCISHDITEFEIVLDSYGPLRHLRISEDVDIPFDFSCGIDVLESLTAEQLMEAASQAEKHHPITDPAIQELLKGVARLASTASGSDERKVVYAGATEILNRSFRLSHNLSHY